MVTLSSSASVLWCVLNPDSYTLKKKFQCKWSIIWLSIEKHRGPSMLRPYNFWPEIEKTVCFFFSLPSVFWHNVKLKSPCLPRSMESRTPPFALSSFCYYLSHTKQPVDVNKWTSSKPHSKVKVCQPTVYYRRHLKTKEVKQGEMVNMASGITCIYYMAFYLTSTCQGTRDENYGLQSHIFTFMFINMYCPLLWIKKREKMDFCRLLMMEVLWLSRRGYLFIYFPAATSSFVFRTVKFTIFWRLQYELYVLVKGCHTLQGWKLY